LFEEAGKSVIAGDEYVDEETVDDAAETIEEVEMDE
jgi:hypothetical protein